MSKHKETGSKGEQIGVKFLKERGYDILHINWCFGKKEIDIIASRKDVLIFIEVKTRSDFKFGFPEEAVTKHKVQYLKAAAEEFIALNPGYDKFQFDIISILLDGDEAKEIKHFEDAFF